MAKGITIFNLFASACSILGLWAAILSPDILPRWGFFIIFGLAAVIIIYVLLVPDTLLERNVRSKITRYRNPNAMEQNGDLVVQRGEFSETSAGTYSIEFYQPFISPPAIEILDPSGHGYVPEVLETTSHQFKLYRQSRAVEPVTFVWIARGQVLKKR